MRLATGGGACVTRVQGVPGWRVICWQFGGGHRFSQRSWQPWRPSRVRSRPPAPSWCARVPASSPESRPAAASRSPRPLPAWPASRAAAVSPPTATSTIKAARCSTGAPRGSSSGIPATRSPQGRRPFTRDTSPTRLRPAARRRTCSRSIGSSPTGPVSPTTSKCSPRPRSSPTTTPIPPQETARGTTAGRGRACSTPSSRPRSLGCGAPTGCRPGLPGTRRSILS